MPPMDATWRGVGAISLTTVQELAPVKLRLAKAIMKSARHSQVLSTKAASAMQDDNSMPPARHVLRARVGLQPALIKRSDVQPPSQLPGRPISGGRAPHMPRECSEKPRACCR